MAESKNTTTTKVTANDPATLTELSRDSDKSTYKAASVSTDETPAPGPSTIQVLGKP